MQGKSVVVTGAAKGIGNAIAHVLAGKGARLALIDMDAGALDKAVGELSNKGHEAYAVAAELGPREACHDAFRQAAQALGRVDSLVNNAGVYIRTPMEKIEDPEWDLIFDVCLRAVFHLSIAAVEHMRGHGSGRIVNIASVDGFVAFPQMAHYAAAKAGVVSITRSMGLAYAPEGILVNGVAPGAVETAPMRENGYMERLAPTLPMKRGAQPEEMAQAVAFLASDANTYMAGETMIVSGGSVIA